MKTANKCVTLLFLMEMGCALAAPADGLMPLTINTVTSFSCGKVPNTMNSYSCSLPQGQTISMVSCSSNFSEPTPGLPLIPLNPQEPGTVYIYQSSCNNVVSVTSGNSIQVQSTYKTLTKTTTTLLNCTLTNPVPQVPLNPAGATINLRIQSSGTSCTATFTDTSGNPLPSMSSPCSCTIPT